jgi:D-alanyl-D-alanine carboxypeptidase
MKYSLSAYKNGGSTQMLDTFASNLCVVNSDIADSSVSLSEASCAGLFDLKNKKTLYAVNVNKQVEPASLTKVMTALVALKYGKLDQMLTASSDVYISENGAQLIGLKEGDQMTLDQALHILLIYSANDVAVMIADNIGGSVDKFVEMMNAEAVAIGATGSHFANPNGLTADEHYVTPYDMYLMFNAAMQYKEFQQIINQPTYTTSYTDKSGTAVKVDIHSTNLYLKGEKEAPTDITVIGGKTGTTNAAGHCLILYAQDKSGNPYISVVMRAEDSDTLYNEMTSMLNKITN